MPDELLRYRARRLRHDATDAESTLWYVLRDRKLAGAKFRRQHPIGPFIVDFACMTRRLIVELDGGQHNDPQSVDRDAARTRRLEAKGWRVLRFWNDEVLSETQAVLEEILRHLERPSPQPSPRTRGEGVQQRPSPAAMRERGRR